MEDDKMLTFLNDELERVDKWLSFGEAKNAALIAFNIAVLSVDLNLGFNILLTILRVIVVSAIIIALISFKPNMARRANEISIRKMKTSVSENERYQFNCIYFSDIATLNNGEKYIQVVKSQYMIQTSSTTNKIYSDLAEEIVINSCIAKGKYDLFKWALGCDFAAMILIIILFICA